MRMFARPAQVASQNRVHNCASLLTADGSSRAHCELAPKLLVCNDLHIQLMHVLPCAQAGATTSLPTCSALPHRTQLPGADTRPLTAARRQRHQRGRNATWAASGSGGAVDGTTPGAAATPPSGLRRPRITVLGGGVVGLSAAMVGVSTTMCRRLTKRTFAADA